MTYLSNWAATCVNVSANQSMTYNGRRWMPAMLDTNRRHRLFKMSRQVGKSTTDSTDALSFMTLNDGVNVLYVCPEQDQARKYSQDKVKPMVRNSPTFQRMIGTYDNVHEKEFTNGSKYYLKYARHNPDSCRGITADEIQYDEVQDQDLDEIKPVIEESLFVSKFKRRVYSGTPKSMGNPIRALWEDSDQREWIVRCVGCQKPINIGVRNIGLEGPSCHHCGKLLDVDNGQWVQMNPGAKIAGFHVHQLHCKISHMVFNEDDGRWEMSRQEWQEILDKYENYDDAKFLNEVLGVSADTDEQPITEEMLKACCGGHPLYEKMLAKHTTSPMYAGIDWGQGKSATTLVIGHFWEGRFRYLVMKRWTGRQCKADYVIPKIVQLLRAFDVKRVHCDHGAGFENNVTMATVYGHEQVTANAWSNSAKAADYRWKVKKNDIKTLTLNKPKAIGAYISRLKRRNLVFPQEEVFFAENKQGERLCDDFLNIRKDQDRNENDMYVKAAGKNDDLLQAAIYCYIIARHDKGNF